MRNSFLIILISAALASCGSHEEKKSAANESQPTEEHAGDATVGRSLYATCAVCHGQKAEGMRSLNAPALVNQEPYYLKQQLNNFRTNKRGVHEKDVFGAQMMPMAKTLNSEGIDNVIAYIKSLEPTKVETTVEGNVENGKNYYSMICGACHGPGAKGIESLHSPKLVGLQDWYLELQINNFRNGIRGTAEGDTYGAQMQQIATAIPDDQTVKDVVAYINSLQSE